MGKNDRKTNAAFKLPRLEEGFLANNWSDNMPDEIQVLDEEEMRASRALLRANAALVSALDHELEARHNLGLPDFEVLMQLSTAPDRSLRMTELAKRVLLSPSGLTRRLDGLVKAGLVQRQPCASDGRGLDAVITPQGEEKLYEMTPTHVNAVRSHLIACVSREDLNQMSNALEQIADQCGDVQRATTDITDSRQTVGSE